MNELVPSKAQLRSTSKALLPLADKMYDAEKRRDRFVIRKLHGAEDLVFFFSDRGTDTP